MLDLFCGLGGWTKGFMAEGWDCVGIDINPQPKYPAWFLQRDILTVTAEDLLSYDFICASSPCEQFSVHCMKHFHPNPKWPELGIKLFQHTQQICEASGKPYVMENVRCAEKFVGKAVNHCGPFYLWGNSVPSVMPLSAYAVTKGNETGGRFKYLTPSERKDARRGFPCSLSKAKRKPQQAEIPIEISRYIAQIAKAICEIHAEASHLTLGESAVSGLGNSGTRAL